MRTADEARELADQCRILANSVFSDSTIVGDELDDCSKDGYTQLATGEVQVATSGVSDPTYALVVAPDEAADDRASYIDALRTARKYLGVADQYRGKWRQLAAKRPKREQSGLRFDCANMHGCPDDKPAERGRDGRCYTCYRFRRRNGKDRRGKYDREVA